MGSIGVASYHFFEETEDNKGSYISYENAPPFWLMDDGEKPPLKKYFEETSYDD